MSLVLRERAGLEIKVWGVNWSRDWMKLQESESKQKRRTRTELWARRH